jgi:hypothetical protein
MLHAAPCLQPESDTNGIAVALRPHRAHVMVVAQQTFGPKDRRGEQIARIQAASGDNQM